MFNQKAVNLHKAYAEAFKTRNKSKGLELLRKSHACLKTYIEQCDHSVGICSCSDQYLLDEIADYLVAK